MLIGIENTYFRGSDSLKTYRSPAFSCETMVTTGKGRYATKCRSSKSPQGMMVGGIEGNSFPAPKPLIQKKEVIRRTGRLSAHGVAQTARLSGCALAAGKASGSRREISIGEEQ
jgi:hypothetical protein